MTWLLRILLDARTYRALTFLLGLVEDILSGKLDYDNDGRVSVKEIAQYIQERAPESMDQLKRLL